MRLVPVTLWSIFTCRGQTLSGLSILQHAMQQFRQGPAYGIPHEVTLPALDSFYKPPAA